MTVTLQMPPGLEARVRDEAMREDLPADAIILRALAQVYPEAPPGHIGDRASAREVELLEKVGLGLTDDQWRRYWELREKLENDALTLAERSELLVVSENIERANATRMTHLVELANLRNVSLSRLMDELGLGNGREARGGSANE
ncbi:MAG TPA: hypothetical protein VG326_15550 [Tepidisphaeraceae bacterium]|jgi:hypothetical protein|nr:hypothetical protein [Tepidisphaeraceae bacterium]